MAPDTRRIDRHLSSDFLAVGGIEQLHTLYAILPPHEAHHLVVGEHLGPVQSCIEQVGRHQPEWVYRTIGHLHCTYQIRVYGRLNTSGLVGRDNLGLDACIQTRRDKGGLIAQIIFGQSDKQAVGGLDTVACNMAYDFIFGYALGRRHLVGNCITGSAMQKAVMDAHAHQLYSGGTRVAVHPASAPASVTAPDVVHQQGSVVYVGRSPAAPSIGDVRVTFSAVYPADISIIAKYNGNTFEKVYASNGKTVSRLSMGVVSADHMFGKAHSSNSTWTWILRVVGIFLVIGGLKSIVAPLSVLAGVIPLLGDIVGAGTGIVCTLLGSAWSFIIIAIAWLRFRPLAGGALIAVAAALVALLYIKGRARKQAAPAAAPQAPAE